MSSQQGPFRQLAQRVAASLLVTDVRAMTEQTSARRWLAIGLIASGLAAGLWLAVGSSQDTRELMDEAAPTALAPGQGAIETRPPPTLEPSPEVPIAPPPDYHIEEGGRLSLDAVSVRGRGVVTLGLALEKEALGGGKNPLSAVVVSAADGRRLELSATPEAGLESGVRLEVDSSWLEPGLYMIQIRTAEKTALPLRRFVLEVRPAVAP
jgi:hypothetical protein